MFGMCSKQQNVAQRTVHDDANANGALDGLERPHLRPIAMWRVPARDHRGALALPSSTQYLIHFSKSRHSNYGRCLRYARNFGAAQVRRWATFQQPPLTRLIYFFLSETESLSETEL